MPDEMAKIATLVEIGRRIINLRYLILSELLGGPDPVSEIEVTLESGARFRLLGPEADAFLRRVRDFIPMAAPAPASTTAAAAVVVRRKRRGEG